MTGESDIRDRYFNLMNGMADSVFEMSDAEVEELILEEGDNTEELRAFFLTSIRLARKQTLIDAKRRYAAEVTSFQKSRFELPQTSGEKRDLLQSMLGSMSQPQSQPLTGQFRDFEEVADEDLDGILLQLLALEKSDGSPEEGV